MCHVHVAQPLSLDRRPNKKTLLKKKKTSRTTLTKEIREKDYINKKKEKLERPNIPLTQ